MAVKYLDFEGGNDSNDGTSFANRWKTFTNGATAARTAPGDVVRIMGTPNPTSLGTTALWTNKDSTITLTAAKNVLITDCETAWTASANVTCTADTTYFRTGTKSAAHDIASGFTTGLASYLALGGAQNYSGYQGITLWVMVRSGSLGSGEASIRLCSDAAGVTTVDTLPIPAIGVADCWVPVYIDKGSALGASIQSIALYFDADPGTRILYLDNISTTLAAGNDCLHLRTLLGKNTAGEYWWGIREINGTAIELDGTPYNFFGTNHRVGRGYWGTTETVTTYIREVAVVTQTTGTANTVQEAGTAGNPITYSGGWDRTNMSTQSLDGTWVDGSGARGTFLATNGLNYITIEKLHAVRWETGLYMTSGSEPTSLIFDTFTACNCEEGIRLYSGGCVATEFTALACANNFFTLIPTQMTITTLKSISGGISGGVQTGFEFNGALSADWQITNFEIYNAVNSGFFCGNSAAVSGIEITTMTVSDCGSGGFITSSSGFSVMHHIRIKELNCTNNTGYGVNLGGVSGRLIIDELNSTGNSNYGLVADTKCGARVTIGSLTTSGNSGGITVAEMQGVVEILKSSIAETTKITATSASQINNPYGRLTLRDYNGTAGDHRSYINGYGTMGRLDSESSVRHTASGLAWRVTVCTAPYASARTPIRIPLATILVNASALVTLKVWMRRNSTDVTGILYVRGGQLDGVASDVTDSITAAVDTWEEQTVTFTPSQAGAIDVEIHCYGGDGTKYLYFDDFNPSQA